MAWSHHEPSVIWTVNDGPDGTLYALDSLGAQVGRFPTDGGRRLRDVEAMAAGPCGEEQCLYIGDTGDNGERRNTVAILRVREPDF